jgi:Predicted hydrolases or acyltransferases (alpha/beta hydrolase superfamily)
MPVTTAVDLDVPAESTVRRANGVDLHVVAAGDPDDPLVVALHGFPEFWYGWHRQIAPLVEAGFRVLVPDQRGYNASDKPDRVSAYRIQALLGDVAALVESEGRKSAHVVGHDWGAVVAWFLALRRPELLDRLAVVNVPHPAAYLRSLAGEQLLRSWYILAMQVPGLVESWWRRTDLAGRVLDSQARPGTFSAVDLDRYRAAWSQSGARTGMCNWYRALVRRPQLPPFGAVETPTLIVWGENDTALVPELADRSLAHCDRGCLERFPDASHWVNHEYPDRVADLLVDHLSAR